MGAASVFDNWCRLMRRTDAMTTPIMSAPIRRTRLFISPSLHEAQSRQRGTPALSGNSRHARPLRCGNYERTPCTLPLWTLCSAPMSRCYVFTPAPSTCQALWGVYCRFYVVVPAWPLAEIPRPPSSLPPALWPLIPPAARDTLALTNRGNYGAGRPGRRRPLAMVSVLLVEEAGWYE